MATKSVWKFSLEIRDEQTVSVPQDAVPLTAQMQRGGELCLWCLVTPGKPTRKLTVRIVGTGHPFPDAGECRYLATAQDHDRQLVWHVFIKD